MTDKEDILTYQDIRGIFGISTGLLTQLVGAGIVTPSVLKVSSGRKNKWSRDDIYKIDIALKLLNLGVGRSATKEFMKSYKNKQVQITIRADV